MSETWSEVSSLLMGAIALFCSVQMKCRTAWLYLTLMYTVSSSDCERAMNLSNFNLCRALGTSHISSNDTDPVVQAAYDHVVHPYA